MNQNRTLADYVELAAKKHRDLSGRAASGRQLAELAVAAGFDVSHNTINRIRKGTYTSTPTTATLRAIAHLAGVPEADVFQADADLADWQELERLFTNWREARNRVADLTVSYARLRGISMATASQELNDTAQLYDDFMKGLRDWAPPWLGVDKNTDEAPGVARVDVSFTERRQAELADAEPTAARDVGGQSEGRRLRENQDRDAEHPQA